MALFLTLTFSSYLFAWDIKPYDPSCTGNINKLVELNERKKIVEESMLNTLNKSWEINLKWYDLLENTNTDRRSIADALYNTSLSQQEAHFIYIDKLRNLNDQIKQTLETLHSSCY